MLSILELKLELEVSGWCTGLMRTAIARAEQSIVVKGKEWQQMWIGCYVRCGRL